MKLITAIVQDADAGRLVDALVKRGFRTTRLQSRGGFLRAGNSTIITGVDDSRLAEALRTIRETCHTRTRAVVPLPLSIEHGEASMTDPVDVEVGGATIFVTPVEHFEQV